MAISIDYVTQVIFVPRADLQLIQSSPSEIRQLDLDAFRLELKDLEDNVEGAVYPITVEHTAPVTISGTTLARVVEIVNGYTVTFEDAQYAVNVVGGNTNLGDVVNVNQVSVRISNSAGLTFSKQVEDQAFEGRVHIDTTNGQSGTEFPRGTPGDPVNNLADAETIIETRTLPKRLRLLGSITVPSGDSLDGYDILGSSYALASIQLDSSSSVDNLVVESCQVANSFSGSQTKYDDCLLNNITNMSGFAFRCKMGGLINISGDSDFLDCYGTAGFIATATGLSVNIVDFSGNATIANIADSGTTFSIGIISGTVTIDSSCIDGEVIVADADLLIDNSGPGCTVTVVNQHTVTQAGLSLIPNATRDATLGATVESSETLLESVRLMRAEAAGKVSVVGNTVRFRDAADTKDRITATTTDTGQRTSVTVDAT